MALADLLKDPRLKPQSADADVVTLTPDFLRRRVRRLVELNPADGDPAKAGDITSAATRSLADLIANEMPLVHAASEEMLRRVAKDPAHLTLDPATLRKRGTVRPPSLLPPPQPTRRRLLRSIVYQAAAFDITLVKEPGFSRLHRICDRRLRIVERMIYDVGRVETRGWTRASIEANRGGPWRDGFERLFEYPRLPAFAFLGACRPNTFGICSPPMNTWGHPAGDAFLHSAIRTNRPTEKSWKRDEYRLDYVSDGGKNPVEAVQGMFEASADYQSRNLLYCDHTIHALHLEALVFSRTKRGEGSAWLEKEVTTQGKGWLRLFVPFGSKGDNGRFLAGAADPFLFEHVTVRESDLQVGDHVIVYNHPAYANATLSGVWRLENAVVVQTSPRLLLQGHGSRLLTKPQMWEEMIGLFNQELTLRRADIERLARVRSFGTNTVTVDSALRVKVRMSVDIVSDDAAETVLAAQRVVTFVNGRVVGYDGASVSATTPHRLRLARTRLFENKYEGIDPGGYKLARRASPQASEFDAANQRADWFLAWVADAGEEAIRRDAARAAFVKASQLIEYTRERQHGKDVTVGWFPLWRASRAGAGPLRRDGKIVRTEPIVVDTRQIAGWTFFFDPDPARRDRVPVVRPKEL